MLILERTNSKIMFHVKPLLLIMIIVLGGCSQGDSDSQKITEFKDWLLLSYSEDNLVSSIGSENGMVSIVFESGESSSISEGLVSVEKLYWQIEFKFSDNTIIEVGTIGEELPIQFSNEEMSLTPLSREFSADVPYKGLIRWVAMGEFGADGDVVSKPLAVNGSLYEFTVHGLYRYGSTNVRIEYMNVNGDVRYSKTFDINFPDYSASIDLDLEVSVLENKNPNSLSLFLMRHRAAETGIFMVDSFGSLRWYLKTPAVNYAVQQTDRGSVLWVSSNKIYEYSLKGDEIENITIPEKYGPIHHDIVDIGGRKFLLTVNHPNKETNEDFVILYDAATESVVTEWNLNESIPKTAHFVADDVDWFHNNAIAFDSRDNSLLLSGQRSGVAKISQSNELIWMLTDPERFRGASSEFQEKILSNQFGDIITWGQHDIRVDEEADVYYLFDNGLGRNYRNTELFSRGVKFVVDESNYTFDVINTFGEEYPELHSPIISGIDYNTEGFVLVNFGSIGYEMEYVSSTDWKGDIWKDPQPDHGAVLLEYDSTGDLTLDMRFSATYPEGSSREGKDPGIYRVRYGDLSQ